MALGGSQVVPTKILDRLKKVKRKQLSITIPWLCDKNKFLIGSKINGFSQDMLFIMTENDLKHVRNGKI